MISNVWDVCVVEGSAEEGELFDYIAQPEGKIGAKKMAKLEEKARKKAEREVGDTRLWCSLRCDLEMMSTETLGWFYLVRCQVYEAAHDDGVRITPISTVSMRYRLIATGRATNQNGVCLKVLEI